MDTRVILYHKTPTSGRTQFLKFSHGGVCGPEPLPFPAELMPQPEENTLTLHHAQLINNVADTLGLAQDLLEPETDFHEWVDVVGGPVQVFLLKFKGMDPPFKLAQQFGGAFIELSAAQGIGSVELELLRSAYECVMEG